MSFDGIVTNSIVSELNKIILDGRVSKVYQHKNDEITLTIRNNGANYRLLISSNSSNPGIYLTNILRDNPQSPPSFCMLLRKHLNGSKILKIEQVDFDRIINISFSSMDELGQYSTKVLVIEIMGKYSNIIFLNKDDNKILDSIKKVNQNMSRVRQILPGGIYKLPPNQNKVNPLTENKMDFLDSISSIKPNMPIFKFFYSNYQGFSPLISKEICINAGLKPEDTLKETTHGNLDSLYNSFYQTCYIIENKKYSPIYITDSNSKIIAFHSLNLSQFGEIGKFHCNTVSEMLDAVSEIKGLNNSLNQQSDTIKKLILSNLERANKKINKQIVELEESRNREVYKIYADLISANIHLIPERANEVQLDNFYDPNLNLITVPLNSVFSVAENAQRYYKKYSKLKNAENMLLSQIPDTEDEIKYLENVLFLVENLSSDTDLSELREELVETGYLKPKNLNKKKQINRSKTLSPHHYISKDGFDIFVGKNNKQNEYLTLKFAHRDDIWFHVQKMPGSHVILKTNGLNVSKEAIEEAAILAAYHSKGRLGSNILVDYTKRKNVRKIPNSKPGNVHYDNFKTITANPYEELVNNINKVEH